MPRVELAIFDIAGTLIEDHNEVTDAFARALRQNNITAEDSEISEFKGSAKREVIWHFVSRQLGPGHHALIDRAYADFRTLLEAGYTRENVIPIRGSDEMLGRLRERGIKLATSTGFYREVRDAILRAAGWEKTFNANVCSDDVARGRPAPYMIFRAMELCGVNDVRNVLVAGDTPLDLRAGAYAGVGINVAVLTGLHQRDRLAREPHTAILSSVAEIPGLIQQHESRP